MGANDNPTLTRHVRVTATEAVFTPVGSVPVLSIRLAGVDRWVMLYDGAAPLERADAFPPAPGQWTLGPDGAPCIGTPSVFTLTADVIGTGLPPPHIFRPDELSVWAIEHVATEMLHQGLVRLFPSWSEKPSSSNPIEQITASIAHAAAAGQFEVVGKLSESLTAMAHLAARSVENVAVEGSIKTKPAIGNRHDRRADRRR